MMWAVYDMNADDMIGMWPQYEDCLQFCVDNQDPASDHWEIFPEIEVIVPVGA